MKLGGFIITYERPTILLQTIRKIFSIPSCPEHLWIVDNSETFETQLLINSLSIKNVTYYRVGKNIGPAGGAAVGLKLVADAGYDWIFWGDDNDPPNFDDGFIKLLKPITSQDFQNVGMLGMVGFRFSQFSGNLIRISEKELRFTNYLLSVESIAGNQSLIVSRKVIERGILPDSDLFFGFEELDFCLKISSAGFLIMVDPNLFLRSRELYRKIGFKQPLYLRLPLSFLPRQYYSVRNILLILKANHLYLAFCYQFLKAIFKLFVGFRYGKNYGMKNFTFVGKGIWDGIRNVKGNRVELSHHVN